MTILDRIARTAPLRGGRTARKPDGAPFRRAAIVDIGSNSVRLVVYDGPRRLPFILFNEKVMAGLGADLDRTGRIGRSAMTRGIAALRRFHQLCTDMDVADIQCVATAAVRDAANGAQFIAQAAEVGFNVRLLSGEEEATASAAGLLSGMPDADGIMGDLGGGSLELARVANGQVAQCLSLPLGALRVAEIRSRGKDALARTLADKLAQAGWSDMARGLPFYMIGGSWRALARIDMHRTGYGLPIFHAYELAPRRIAGLVRLLDAADAAQLKAMPFVSSARAPTLPHAAALLAALVRQFDPASLIVSAYGLREGLLYRALPPEIAAEDPLLVAARAEGEAQGRFPGHGDQIDRWIAPLFPDDAPAMRRIRQAACLLADVGWRANPDFRAERGLETGLHGNWVGINGAERAMLAQALYTSLGGSDNPAPTLGRLAEPDLITRARQWGLAIRLAQRLSGGVAASLERARLTYDMDGIMLTLTGDDADLTGESVERRLKQLGQAMRRGYRIATTA